MLCLLDPGDGKARRKGLGCGEFRQHGRGTRIISGRFGKAETVTFTVRVGHNSRQGAGGDNRLCKGTTTSKGLVETTGCGRAQPSERF